MTTAAPAPAPAEAAPPGPVAGAAQSSRWLGLDALRGLTIAAMILVNNPGRWGERYQYAPLRHATWHGCTFTDLVFPTFLFLAGVAIVPAFAGKLARGVPRGPLVARIGRRVVLLCLLGMMLSAFPFVTFAASEPLFAPLRSVRVPGVLQRIGVCYGIAAVLFLFTSARVQRVVLWSCLLLYWPLITLVPLSSGALPDLDVPTSMLHVEVDRWAFGSHVWRHAPFDPEGLLSTIPALATCLFGVEAGRVLLGRRGDPSSDGERVRDLLVRGALLLAAGSVWGWFLPINKQLWTGSYAVFTAGVATTGLALATWFFDARGHRRLAHPLQVYGVNALLVFVGSGLLGRVTASLWTVPQGGRSMAVKEWFFTNALLSWCEPMLASLLFAVLWILGWYAVLAVLYRRGIVWKV